MFCRSMRVSLVATILILGLAAVASAQTAASFVWSDVSSTAIAPAGERVIIADPFRALSLDRTELGVYLSRVPLENSAAATFRPELELPLPDGTMGRFAIVESPIMAPELQARYPEIRTYAGYGVDDPSAYVRFDLTPAGFHAMIFSSGGTIFIDPYQLGDDRHYQSYYKRDFRSDKLLGGCTIVDDAGMAAEIERLSSQFGQRSGTQLRTYRTVVAATGEYTAHFGGTVALAMAAIVTSMNRVDGVYELEVAVRMVLVANNDLVVYTNAATDPYTNADGATMLSQNQATCDAVIGSANYDIGHVFSTGGGGIAGLGVVCNAARKAQGVTGSPQPHGDAYDIDYVAHEIGHQFGSNHPFNGNAGSCAGGNRNASTAYEPGSGSTIMAYAGICAPQNLQTHSDPYFLWKSIEEIITYTNSGYGNICAVRTNTGVVQPAIEAGTGGFSIPIGTPFSLTCSATTVGTPTYCWEESDLGPAGAPTAPVGNAPIFRSFVPVTSPTRIFPKVSDLLANTSHIGEILPTYARTLSFRATVRDVQATGVGVAIDNIVFSVAAAGPFLVTSPNTAVNWPGGTAQTVTWNVAGTDAAPISCANVNILLSTDGGYTWPTVLASGTPNDGSELVTLPLVITTTARIKVEAVGNVFFDLSNLNFTISQPPTGACCAPDGSCTVTESAACTAPNTWSGIGTSCTPNLCVATGACCAPDAGCTVTVEAACTAPNSWSGAGTNCSPSLCVPTGACCAPTGICTMTTEAACVAPSTWQGLLNVCPPYICPQPTGSCCAPVGTCTVTLLADCAAPSAWTMFGVCEPNTCIPIGACCAPDGSCTVAAEAACVTPNTWSGAGTSCSPNACIQPPGACCYPDGSCIYVLHVDCIDFGLWLGYGTVCSPNPCEQPTGSCCYVDGTCQLTLGAACTGTWTMFGVCVPNTCAPSGVESREFDSVLGVRANPNPFAGSVSLRVAGPNATAARVLIFDAAGRLVRTAWSGSLSGRAFNVVWDGRDDAGHQAATGIYMVRLDSAAGQAIGRIVKLR
jgi:hypothetical protein